VSIVEVTASTAARVRDVPVTAAVPLRTVRGTLAELSAVKPDERAWLRVYVRETPRAGLREEVQALLPRALEVRIDPQLLPRLEPTTTTRTGHSPRELFGEYLTAKGVDDEPVVELFNRLYEEVTS